MAIGSETTKCFSCGNVVNGCSWARNSTPVAGWTARKDILKSGEESYMVFDCPEYTPHKPIALKDEAIADLAIGIVKRATEDYRRGLEEEAEMQYKDAALNTKRKLYKSYHQKLYGYKGEPTAIKTVEHFLKGAYGGAMLGNIQPETIINGIRAEYKLPFPKLTPEKLKDIRKRLGLTRKEMAKEIGCTYHLLYEMERGACKSKYLWAAKILKFAEEKGYADTD